jgi:hypothetical protein
MTQYDYDYHNLVEDIYFIDDEDILENNDICPPNWENYYHNITQELVED